MNIDLTTNWKIAIVVLLVWELLWKAIALWRAARNDHRGWFLAVLILNTAGVLPIIYLLSHTQSEDAQRSRKGVGHETVVPV